MIFLNPQLVTLAGVALPGVRAIAVSRRAERLVLSFTDLGPHPAFADAPEQRTTITVRRDLLDAADDPVSTVLPGDQAELSFTTSPNASDAGARIFAASVVVTAIESDLRRDSDAVQTITCILISPTGAEDPFSPVTEQAPPNNPPGDEPDPADPGSTDPSGGPT